MGQHLIDIDIRYADDDAPTIARFEQALSGTSITTVMSALDLEAADDLFGRRIRVVVDAESADAAVNAIRTYVTWAEYFPTIKFTQVKTCEQEEPVEELPTEHVAAIEPSDQLRKNSWMQFGEVGAIGIAIASVASPEVVNRRGGLALVIAYGAAVAFDAAAVLSGRWLRAWLGERRAADIVAAAAALAILAAGWAVVGCSPALLSIAALATVGPARFRVTMAKAEHEADPIAVSRCGGIEATLHIGVLGAALMIFLTSAPSRIVIEQALLCAILCGMMYWLKAQHGASARS